MENSPGSKHFAVRLGGTAGCLASVSTGSIMSNSFLFWVENLQKVACRLARASQKTPGKLADASRCKIGAHLIDRFACASSVSIGCIATLLKPDLGWA